jgi:hypothetical protein
MSIKKHQLFSEKLKGFIVLVYENGLFKSLLCEFDNEMSKEQFSFLKQHIPLEETEIGRLSALGLNPKGKATMQTNEKIAAFCREYEKVLKIKYKVSPSDAGKLKLVKIDEELLQVYFTSTNFIFKNKSIGNLVKYYNELRAEAEAQKTNGGISFPNIPDAKFEKNLKPYQVPEYWKHLRSLGYLFINGQWKMPEKI